MNDKTESDLERFAVTTLKLSTYRAALLVAYFRFLQTAKLTRENLLKAVRLT